MKLKSPRNLILLALTAGAVPAESLGGAFAEPGTWIKNLPTLIVVTLFAITRIARKTLPDQFTASSFIREQPGFPDPFPVHSQELFWQ